MIEHKGKNRYRLKDVMNRLERVFAEEWQKLNDQSRALERILADDKNNPVCDFSDRDVEVAATVIQWLGTNVGQCFLNTVKDRAAEDDECMTCVDKGTHRSCNAFGTEVCPMFR